MRLIACILISIFYFYPLTTFSATGANTENTQGLHLDWLNKNIAPGKNFFEFANGSWQKKNPIPAAYPMWGVANVLSEQNQQQIRQFIEAAANNKYNKPNSNEQKIGDFYLSGMDEKTINKIGVQPLQPEFSYINNIKNLVDLQKTITHLHLIGVNAIFDFSQMQDFNDSRNVIGVASQAGLGLPDRDYYLKDEAKLRKIRQIYVHHIIKMFELLGDNTKKATAEAKTIMNIETILAKASMPKVEQRNPHAIYHMMDLAQLEKTTPNFSWVQYFTDLGYPEIKRINLAMPNFFVVMNTQLKDISINDWKIYLRWHLISSFASYLSKPFVNENFRMYSALTGTQKLLPRWKRVIRVEEHVLGFAIGKIYVEKYFPPSSKKEVQEILTNIHLALKNELQNLDWMSHETRQAALKKLDMMKGRIGYPDKWRDYSALKIDRGPYVLNIIRANIFLTQYDLNKIGKPVDKNEWFMTPQTINAYYNPYLNELNLPAGILQPPFFDAKAPASINYGGIGSIIGHEITHGFDDQGAQFDGDGNLKNWWSKEDLKKFKVITGSIAKQFSQYIVDGNVHLQGKLVTGEATADLGGLILAYHAFHASNAYEYAKTINGFTPDQQFFLSAAHIWAENIRPDLARTLAITDPHPPSNYRVNGMLANMVEFKKAFNIASNSPMVNPNRTIIW